MRSLARLAALDGLADRLPEPRRLLVLDAVQDDLGALHDVVDVQVADGAVADERGGEVPAHQPRPRGRRGPRQRHAHPRADAAVGQRLAARGGRDEVALRTSSSFVPRSAAA